MEKIKMTTDEHYKAIQWCLKNDIKVSAYATKKGLKVETIQGNKKIISPKIYSKIEATNKIWEIYLYIYKKHNKI